jgi:hypothetical protein
MTSAFCPAHLQEKSNANPGKQGYPKQRVTPWLRTHHRSYPSQTPPTEAARNAPRVSGSCSFLCLFGEVFKVEDTPPWVTGPTPFYPSNISLKEARYTRRARYLAGEGTEEPSIEAMPGKGVEVPASHLLLPLNLQSGRGLVCRSDSENVLSNQTNGLCVSSDSRTLGNGNSAKRGSVRDDLGDRLQLKTSSIEPTKQ